MATEKNVSNIISEREHPSNDAHFGRSAKSRAFQRLSQNEQHCQLSSYRITALVVAAVP